MSTLRWVLLLAAGTVLLFSVDVNIGKQCGLLDPDGKAVQHAYITYHYAAGTKLIWPWAYYRGPFLLRPDRDGRFTIPTRVYLRFPFMSVLSPVRLHVGAYVPHLSNFCGLFDPAPQDSYCARFEADGRTRVRMRNLVADPAARFHTLWQLIYSPQYLDRTSPGERKEVLTAVRKEYDDFLSAYGQAVFENSYNKWGYIKIDDWTKENGAFRPWRFFLQDVPFYGNTMEQKLSAMERQAN